MEKKEKSLKWTMMIVIITHLLCFFPNDMMPLPIIIVEQGLIDGFFKWGFSYEIISKFIVAGQILAFLFLIFKITNLTLIVGVIATILMLIGNTIWLIEAHVYIRWFEFATSIPFLISIIVFWAIGFRLWFKQ